jgi:mRNA interferase RelE/StbE
VIFLPEFEVFLSNNAEKGLGKSGSFMKKRLQEALDELENNPVPIQKFDVTKLSGSESNYRIRIGQYRILYSIKWNEKQIHIFDIDKRKDRTYK